mmetsp:Transcript_21001/g.52090  ORF Transcript_21001/g.52090 Transcript_21001/m.52090 type:complete len:143 (-) Transcript_21001:590-1018(-)|eukprot:CAMPEP_0116087194 /NCGR_PEP_ID=MMETSP0327-20121206/5240_1 /TAXON_ID=44447 /ORGANISM="Pseudo-nitzschia delicatissima, Strain B596" /LENGTH=142 /DNA_ID=CAMNT_0003578259 /DNA_START=11 /DNA_END=439 /DNA_ORIENTATION=+
MTSYKILSALLLVALSSSSEAFSSPSTMSRPTSELSAVNDSSRRSMFKNAGAFAAAVVFTPVVAANALDMEAFANSQIADDVKNCNPKLDPKCIPKLTPDEALCKYGQSGTKKSEACRRVKAAGGDTTQAQQGRSLGGAYAI